MFDDNKCDKKMMIKSVIDVIRLWNCIWN